MSTTNSTQDTHSSHTTAAPTDPPADTEKDVTPERGVRYPAQGGDLRPWSPWRELAPFGVRFDDLVDRLWSGVGSPGDLTPAGALHEEDSAFVVELDLPGVDKSDVTVEVSDRRLTVSGTRHESERTGVLRHSTRVTGRFSYTALLPSAVDDDAVTASMADGVLTVTLPKVDGTTSRRIDVS